MAHCVRQALLLLHGLASIIVVVQAAAIRFDDATSIQKPLLLAPAAVHGQQQADGQKKLNNPDAFISPTTEVESSSSSSPSSFPSWKFYPQDDRTCAANTTRHFTGRAAVTAEKELFFWFVESRRDPLNDPTILWINGGPAASSMPGFFQEIGPCELLFNETETETGSGTGTIPTKPNPHSWANFANILVLDQPAGAGLSTAAGDSAPITLAEATVDFDVFLKGFVRKFPQYFGQDRLYVAGESFGGRYAPRYIADIMSTSGDGEVKVDGLILVDAFVDGVSHTLGHHELFCSDEYQDVVRYNGSACASIANAIPRAEYLLDVCQASLDPRDCEVAVKYAHVNIEKYLRYEENLGRVSRYDLRLPCELPEQYCIPPSVFYSEPYLNHPEIQKLLGFETPREYRSANFSLNTVWSEQPEILLPTTRNVSWLLDESALRILVFNGVYDAAITTPGMFREFDHLPWSKRDTFRENPKTDWYWTDLSGNEVAGGRIKGNPKLQVASVYNASHMSPGDAKPAVSSLVQQWIESPGHTIGSTLS